MIPYSGNYAIPGVTEPLLQNVMRQGDDGWGGDDFGSDFGDDFGKDADFGTRSKAEVKKGKAAANSDFSDDFSDGFGDDFGDFGNKGNVEKVNKGSKAGSKGGFGSGFGDDFSNFGANFGKGRTIGKTKGFGAESGLGFGAKGGDAKKDQFSTDQTGKSFGKPADFGKGFDKNFGDAKSDSASFFGSGKGGSGGKEFGQEFGSDFESFDKGASKKDTPGDATFTKNNEGGGYHMPRRSADAPQTPATCRCKKQRYGGGTCYFFTDESNGICARRDCMPKYVCVNGPSTKHDLLCMKRKTMSKIVKTGPHTCVKKKTYGYMFVPYTST